MLEKCDWPTQSVVGEKKGATNAWLIAQHADTEPAFQTYAASKMKVAVLAGEAKGNLLALLVDRNRRLQNQPQVYGMQFNIQESSKVVFLTVEAPELLNQRRKEIGLEPFVCYINSVTREKKLPATCLMGFHMNLPSAMIANTAVKIAPVGRWGIARAPAFTLNLNH